MKIEQATRRGDDDIDALFECLDLDAVTDAAVEQRRLGAEILTVLLEVFVDLHGEFAGWDKDEAAGLAGGWAEASECRQSKGSGLTGAGLGGADEVATGKHHGDSLLLNGRGVHVTAIGERAKDWLREANFSKRRHDVRIERRAG